MKGFLSFGLLLLVYTTNSYAQEKNKPFRHLTTNQGLSQNNVTSVVMDRRGFMWFGTQDGLNMYDGYEFTIYRNDPQNPHSIPHNSINILFKDRKGRLWIGTDDGGLSFYDYSQDNFINYRYDKNNPASLVHNKVMSIAEDASGNLWIATGGGGLDYFDTSKKTFKHFVHKAGDAKSLSDNFVKTVLVDHHGIVWVGTQEGGLNRFNSDTGSFTHYLANPAHPGSLSKNEVNRIYEDAKNRLWIATENGGLNLMDSETNTFRVYRHQTAKTEGISHNDIISFAEDKKGRLWIGTRNGGINILEDNGQITKYVFDKTNPDGLNNGSIYALFCDGTGNMWVGTFSGGVNVMDYEPLKFKRYNSVPGDGEGMNNDNILAVVEDLDGKVWLGTDGGGINIWDRKTGKFEHLVHQPQKAGSIAGNFITSLHLDEAGKIWAGNYKGGLSVYNRKTGNFDNLNKNPRSGSAIPYNIYCIADDRNGFLWLGTSNGLVKYDKSKNTYTVFEHDPANSRSISGNIILATYVDHAGNIWAGSEGGGLNYFDQKNQTFTYFTTDIYNSKTISSNLIYCITEDSKGNFWVGTAGGLNLFDRKTRTFTSFRSKDGLPNDVIWGIQEDSKANLWISTNNGLTHFDPATKKFRNFDISDGLQGTSFNRVAAFTNKQGEMFFGGQAGFNVFHPDSIRYNTFIPPVFIIDFQIFNKPVEFKPDDVNAEPSHLTRHITSAKEITVSYKDLMLSFEFTALNYTISRKNKYAYKLEGFDSDWIYSNTTRIATYTNMDPGDYVFRVKASNNDGVWNETGTSLVLHVIPPFWKTWWFRGLFILITALAIYILYQARVRVIKSQRKALQKLVNERTKEVLEKTHKLEQQASNLYELNEELHLKHIEEQEARKEAEKANQAKSVFLATMSHEIRTPMNGILGMAELLSQTNMTEEQADYTETIIGCGDGLLAVINDILDFSKIESGNMELEKKPFNLHDCIEEVLGIFTVKAAGQGLRMIYKIDPQIPARIVGDNLRLRQVLINLVNNAVKFTQEGEIQVSVECKRRSDDGEIELTFQVRDTGIGIPMDKLDLLFKAFSQVDSSHSRKYGGTGLGLVISQRLVQLMGGRIYAESEEGKGTAFYFTIITHLAENVVATEPKSNQSKNLLSTYFAEQFPMKLLIAEDNLINEKLLVAVLSKLGYPATVTRNGKETLLEAGRGQYDVIFMDVQMPEMDGLEATAMIRKLDGPQPYIVAVTANVMPEDRAICLQAGMDDYVSKPIRYEEIKTSLQRAYGLKHAITN